MSYIALDTEFVWQRTYYANLGLVQAAMSADFDAARLPSAPPAACGWPQRMSREARRCSCCWAQAAPHE